MSETRPAPGHRRRVRIVVLGLVVAVLAGMVVWWVNHPRGLPTSGTTVSASTVTGQPVYVGVFVAPADFDRSLELSGVKVHVTANTRVEVVPLLCRQGSISVTTDPEPFCEALANPENETFGAGDAIVLEVAAEETAIAVIDRVRLGFRERLQWGTQEAGSAAIVSIQAR